MTTNPIVHNWVHDDPPTEPDVVPYPPPLGEVPPPGQRPRARHIDLTPASAIKPKRVRWIWKDRLAQGTLGLLAGREGLGKSTLAYAIAADVTRGTLPGEYEGHPHAVLVCASEDSWEHTIVPRLIAAGADLELVYRVEMVTHDELRMNISLPKDFLDVEHAAEMVGAGLMILDPLMSVIDSKLDTHKDAEVRQSLEPLKALAERAHMAVLGLIHHNKSGSTDPLQLVMGSKAFSAVARSVHTCIPDPDDDTGNQRIFATSKNNLGRTDLPILGFTISGHAVETEDDGVAWTGRLHWTGEIESTMHELMTRGADPERSATGEAADWLREYLETQGGDAPKVDIEKAGRAAGHAPRTLQRARERLRLEHRSAGFPRRTFWSLPGAVPRAELQDVQDVTEPVHEHPAAAAQDDVASGANEATSTSGANPGGTTAEADPQSCQPDRSDPSRASRANDGTTVAQLDLTSGFAEEPHARVHARGDGTTGTTGEKAPLHDPSRASHASRANAPHAHARDPIPPPPALVEDWAGVAPLCPDCEHPLDSHDHELICEAS